MPRYDSEQFDPPAPVVEVALHNSPTGESLSDVKLLLDTGADVTLLPHSAVNRLRMKPESEHRYELVGFDGQHSFAESVVLDMTFLAKTFRGRYLLTSEETGILGRDVLNYFIVVLNGPAGEWRQDGS